MQKRNSKVIGSKILAYLKKNIYYVMMIACVITIATVVTVVAVVNSADSNTPVDNNLGQDDQDKPVDKPDDNSFVLSMPVAGGKVIREFNDKTLTLDVTQNDYRTHTAVDLSAKTGAEVVAMYDGLVKEVTSDKHYGTVVVIEHKNGYVSTLKLLDKVNVNKDQRVKKGDKLGVVGAFLFECKQDSHIHCELTKDGKAIDMMQFIVNGDK